MKIAVIGEQNEGGGGSYHLSLKTFEILSDINNSDFKFYYLSSNKFRNENFLSYNITLIDKIFFFIQSSDTLRTIFKKFQIQNKFEKFLKRKNIDLIIFLGCSRFSIFCDEINFLTFIYEFHHIFRPDLPEYKGWAGFDYREELLKINVRKSLSLIVDTKKKSDDLIKYYNCYDKKINVIPLISNLTNDENKNEISLSKKVKDYLDKKDEYFFYPAQYLSHKNHYYILSALKILNEKNIKNIKFVFTGNKPKNLKYLQETVENFNLSNNVTFFDYVNNNDIKSLYQNCKGLVMPSLVGYSSLPLYEAFYFEKPVFYSKNLLDTNLQNFVTEIDLDNPISLADEISNFEKNKPTLENKIRKAKLYYNENLTKDQIAKKYLALLNKIQNEVKLYK